MSQYLKYLTIPFLLLQLACGSGIEQPTGVYTLSLKQNDAEEITSAYSELVVIQKRNAESLSFPGKIKRRGGASIIFDKHSYELDLKEDLSLCSLPADDDWILNANYIDKTFLRHALAYELFRKLHSNNIAPFCQHIELEINQNYQGLYVLMEKLDASSLKINRSDSSSYIFKEPPLFRQNAENYKAQKPENFHQQTFPKLSKRNKSFEMENLRNFILRSSEEDFQMKFKTLFDFQNIIDWHLLLLISNNGDGLLKNFYLYKVDRETAARVAIWDFDHSFGRDGDNELNMDTRPMDFKKSILFARLLNCAWYRSALKKRWDELNRSELLSAQGLMDRISESSTSIQALAIRNFDVWSPRSKHYYDSNNFEEEVELMRTFIALRHKRLVEYFENSIE